MASPGCPAEPLKGRVDECYQGDEREEHGPNVESEAHAVRGAARGRVDYVRGRLLDFDLDCAPRYRAPGFRNQDLCQHERRRGGHDARREQVLGEELTPHRIVTS